MKWFRKLRIRQKAENVRVISGVNKIEFRILFIAAFFIAILVIFQQPIGTLVVLASITPALILLGVSARFRITLNSDSFLFTKRFMGLTYLKIYGPRTELTVEGDGAWFSKTGGGHAHIHPYEAYEDEPPEALCLTYQGTDYSFGTTGNHKKLLNEILKAIKELDAAI